MYKVLIYARRITAALAGGLILLFFIDLTRILPDGLHWLMHIQIVPALMAGLVGILVINLAMALLVGRVYCSVLCPLGILQDFICRAKRWWVRIVRKKKRLKLKYSRPLNVFRYTVLSLTALSFFVFGGALLVLLLDPYSNFGRIAVSLFKPAAVWGNNMIAVAANDMGNYNWYNMSIHTFSPLLLIFSAVLSIALVVMAWRRQRLWCNTVCPVGALLSLFSRFSLVRISIDESKCTHCRRCTKSCKSRCIDDRRYHVDSSRCVNCYNCLGTCKFDAIGLKADGWNFKRAGKDKKTDAPAADSGKNNFTSAAHTIRKEVIAPENPAGDGWAASDTMPAKGGVSRELFLRGSAVALAAIPLSAFAIPRDLPKRGVHARPPGAVKDFAAKCTACQLCVSRCPMQVIKPAFLENGFTGMMQPYMYFQPHCYCNYECTICGDVCPNRALEKLTVEQKRLRQIGVVNFVIDECIVKSEDQDCGACAEHCPTGAVKMVLYRNGLTIPEIEPEICIGCGACESICPVRPDAIFIEGLREQGVADPPHIQESTETVIEDFGF